MADIKKNYNALKRNAKRYLKSDFFRAKYVFTQYYEEEPIDSNAAFFESYNNSNFSGNVYYILLEINHRPELREMKKYVSCKKDDVKTIENNLKNRGIQNVEVVAVHTKEYCKALATSKYLFNNATFPSYFIKRDEQIYLNTWHGTPLKTLGRSIISSPEEIGNTQRNFFMADYLLYPNQFTYEHMKEDYMLNHLFKGQYILGGYPRNHVFYDKEGAKEIRASLELEDKEVFVYMPTWRGTLDHKNKKEQAYAINYYLLQMEKSLNKNRILYVKLHNFVSAEVDFSQFKYIRPFPEGYETYEFLNIADCLITDYSSVFFDFANTGKKVILFMYDKEEYFATRGTYMPVDDLPFPIVETLGELSREMEDVHDYQPYPEFIQTYCAYDHEDYAKKIVDLVFKGEKDLTLIDGDSLCNHKKNILIYGGALAKNGLTTSLRGLLNHVDTSKYNYILLFYRTKVAKNNSFISEMPKEIAYISMQGQKNMTIQEAFVHYAYYRKDQLNEKNEALLRSIYQREVKRLFGTKIHFDHVIHFTGYEKQVVNLLLEIEGAKKAIYVHNDMNKEKKTRGNFHFLSIEKAYRQFDTIVPIRESMKSEILELVPGLDEQKIHTVHNTNDIDAIIEKASFPLVFDKGTNSTHTVEEIEAILSNANVKKYVNVARFSPEKGLKRLCIAFETFQKAHPDSYLFVIGGHGNEYKDILEYVQTNELNHIVIIRSLSNPFPIVAKCDVFIMSSLYEGLPMSIMEALILNKPVVCTDITGPREFLSQGYGYLVEDSTDGVLKGFEDSYDHDLQLKPFDALAFNKQALDEFEALFD